MAEKLRIIYLDHSGFAVETDKLLLVFDYARGAPPPDAEIEQGHITRAFVAAHERCFVFVSHGHSDHFNAAIYDWADIPGVEYILGNDMDRRKFKGRHMAPGDVLDLPDLTITAHASTDLGVSFLVNIPDYALFHAGDLNLWHWRNESTLREIEQAEQSWRTALAPLNGVAMDFAFFPVDPRQGSLYDAGASQFVLQIKPRVFLPMHWQGRADVAMEFARRNRSKRTEIIALTRPGETLTASRDPDNALQLSLNAPAKAPDPAAAPKED